MVELENGNIIRVYFDNEKWHAVIGGADVVNTPRWNATADSYDMAVALLMKTIRECPTKFFFNKYWKDPCKKPEPLEMVKVSIPKEIREKLVELARESDLPLFTLLDNMIKDAQSKRSGSDHSNGDN